MSIYSKLERFFEACTAFFWRMFIYIHELKNIWSKRALVKSYVPTSEQAEEARVYWKGLTGRRWPLWWHRLYAGYTGTWDPRYIPEMLFSVWLEPRASRRCDRDALGDKNNLVLFTGGGFRMPDEYARSSNGLISRNGVLLSMPEAIEELGNIGPCVIKKTRGTSSGRDVAVANFRDGKDAATGKTIESCVNAMGADWICQERVRQHESIAAIYPGCVNTMRIVTYMTPDGIEAAPVTLRVGQGGSLVDNAHAGGMFVHVHEDGTLGAEAFTEYQKRYGGHPDTGIVFKDHRIAGVAEALEAAKRSHLAVGEFGFVSWDICIDSEGMPTLIEVNLTSQTVWFPQMASGQSIFGDDTPAVVRAYLHHVA